jgi:hypothetical protein
MQNINRKYPENYSREIKNLIDKLQIEGGEKPRLVGTSALRLNFVGDYDLYQKVNVKSAKDFCLGFQNVIRKLLITKLLYIGDIKSGEVPEFKVLDNSITVQNYNQKRLSFIEKVKNLCSKGYISTEELNENLKMLKPSLKAEEIAVLKKELRYEVIRWTPRDVLNGYVEYRTKVIYLNDYLLTNSITKIDIVFWLNGIRFNEMSIMYLFVVNGKEINNFFNNIENIVREQILVLDYKHKYFKICKRLYTLERIKLPKQQDKKLMELLFHLFNSDLSIISQVMSDLETLVYLKENVSLLPKYNINFEIDQMRNRLGIIRNNDYIKDERIVDKLINLLDTNFNLGDLEQLFNILNTILQHETLIFMKHNNLYPIPKKYIGLNII